MTSTAIHRPRDIGVVLDFSGSMRFSSLLGVDYATSTRASNNPDGLIPVWGHYSATSSAALQAATFTLPYNAANITTTTSDGRPPVVQDFYVDSSGTQAFTFASAAYASTPGGDPFLMVNKNTGSTYATCPADLLKINNPTTSTRDATFETWLHRLLACTRAGTQGYTKGPGYWGKTSSSGPPIRPTTGGKRSSPIRAPTRRWTTTPGSGTTTATGKHPVRRPMASTTRLS